MSKSASRADQVLLELQQNHRPKAISDMPQAMPYLVASRIALAFVAVCAVGLATAAPQNLSETQARHLLVRTGFAPTQVEVNAIVGQSAQKAVNDLIARAQNARPLQSPPQFTTLPPPIPPGFLKTKEEQQAARQQQLREGLELKSWWMREMIESPAPLAERMTLFWHNHFATSQQKVVRSQAMWKQQQLLRAQALGSFRTLLHTVAKDPAMLVYLDGANSRKEAPNENFAREVMELFTLGEATQGGGYTEQDIKQAARAFTGWSVERDDFSYRYRPAFHDDGVKTVLGRSGNFDGDQVLDILLDQPAAARYITAKLWKEFVSPAPQGPQEVEALERMARQFRAGNFNIAALLNQLLLSDAFWADANRGSLIKSPIDLVVGTVRQFGFSYTEAMPFVLKSAQLGQNLLMPPNVKGWPGYTDWIDSTSLLERKRFTEQLFRSVELKGESKAAQIDMAPSGRLMVPEAGDSNAMQADSMQAARGTMREQFGADAGGPGSARQALALLGRDGILRVAQGMAKITFDPQRWLASYGAFADREPTEEQKTRLAGVLLSVPATQSIAQGTVGVAWLRSLTLDPSYQLK